MRSTILAFTTRSLALLLLVTVVSITSAQICVDGDYCPNPDFAGGVNCVGEADDEWGLASSSGQLPTSSSSTCHVMELFGYADVSNLYLGMEVGNSGTAFFYVYFDTDCDSTNNDQCHTGADFRVKFRIKNNGVIEAFEIQEYAGPNPSTNSAAAYCMNDNSGSTGIGGEYSSVVSSSVVTLKGNIDGCSGSDNIWVEISFALLSVFDPCDPTTSCGGIEITAITSQEGGSESSNDCETFGISVPIPINNPPTAVIDPIPPCIYSDAEVCFNGSNSSDPDSNIIAYEWDLDYDGVNFNVDTTGVTVCTLYPPGSYTAALRVVDTFNCADTALTGIVDFIVVDANDKVNAACVDGLVDCPGDMNGEVSVVASGGTPGYIYHWSSGGTTAIETGLSVGDYEVTVTDVNGCTDICTASITSPSALTAICSTNHTNDVLDCFGDTDGMVSATVGGGTPGYTYLWSTGATTISINGLGIGTYTVTVTDSKGCEATCSETLSQPPLLTVTCGTNHVNNELDCFGDTDGVVSATAGGGTPGYTYLWNTGATTTSITGLGIGAYSVTVTDSKGCEAACSVTLSQPPVITATCGTNHLNNELDCFGDTDGMVSAMAGGGTAGYTYLWSNGATTTSISNLGIGTYDVTVTDSKGCTATCSEMITEPPMVTAMCTTNHTNNRLDCFGDMDGMVSVTAGGGTVGYTYVWSNGATTTSISNLGIGTYDVTVTDSKGCTATCSKMITEPPMVTATCTTNHSNNRLDCFGDMDGMVSVTAGGGTAGYTYLWGNGATNSSISNLGIGTYGVTVTDSKGCTATCSENIIQPLALSCSITGGNASCGSGGGNADAEVVGGSIPYAYLWSNGATTEDLLNLTMGNYTLTVTDAKNCTTTCSVLIDGMTCTVNQTACDINGLRGATSAVIGGTTPFSYIWSTGETTSSISKLIPGRHSLLVTDANECETECEVIIDRCNVCDAICSTSFARLDGQNACFDQQEFDQWGWTNGLLSEGSYTFDLYAEALQCDINVGELVGQVAISYDGDEVEVTYTTFGNYYMTLTSLYIGCDAIPLVNGVEFVSPSQYPYQQVQNNVTSYTTIIDVSTLPCEGIFLIAHAEVCAPDPMTCEITGTAVDCNGGTNGAADATVIGGTAPYIYLWSTTATTEDISGLAEGIYELTITDVNNCSSSCQVRIGHAMIALTEMGPYCRNDAPVDLSALITDPGAMGTWFGDGVINEIFYPSNLPVGKHYVYYDDEITCQSAALTIQITEQCCPLDYAQVNSRMLIGNQTVTMHYETDGILESVQNVEANTIYDSKLEITLYGEFEVKLGTEFDALIDGCP